MVRGSVLSSLLWVLSAGTTGSLRVKARLLHDHLAAHPGLALAEVGRALADLPHPAARRAALVAADRDGLLSALSALADGRGGAGVAEGHVGDSSRTAFVFPGQGAQWPDMAVDLLASSPVFANRMDECAQALEPFLDWSLLDGLRDTSGSFELDRADVAQPALFAVMVSLAALWRSHGVEPAAVLGHSLGEIAAAVTADALTLDDGARVAALWSQQQATLAGAGDMVSVLGPVDVVRARLDRWVGRLGIAAVNGPESVIVSGDADAAAELLADFAETGLRARRIAVGLAAHSAHIDRITPRLADLLAPIQPRTPQVRYYSSTTATPVDDASLDAGYWCRNLRAPVLFEQSVRAALADGIGIFLEVSPHPVLTAAIQQTAETAVVRGSLWRGQGTMDRFLRTLGELYVAGVEPAWDTVYGDAHAEELPPELTREHDGAAVVEAHGESTLHGRLVGMSATDQHALLVDLVRSEVRDLLGRPADEPLDPLTPFVELGFDSVTALEIRNRLAAATGVTLPVTMAYDHPNPTAVAEFVRAALLGTDAVAAHLPAEQAGSDDDPIVVVGMGCRFPGGANSPDDLWRLVYDGVDALTPLPTNRGWDITGGYRAELTGPGQFYQREGGFLHDADLFDAQFFGISPREATAMDPQQRLLLETSWEALERAGIRPSALRGSRTGVFVGAFTAEYGPRMDDGSVGEGYVFTGNTGSVMSGRISYLLGLEGPAVTVDTACSSSLVALHLAAHAIRRGECDLAIVGGVTVMPSMGMFMEISRLSGLVADGRSKAFSSTADGFGLAEGAGTVVVERLSTARRHGHDVLAVVRGSAINQDGASNGLTAPSGPAQQRVIRQALANAGLGPADVDVVEAHGTGTPLGDPIEATAILATYGQHRDRPLWLGSVKSNIGHTQAAAGAAGLIKMILALRHGVLPRTLHVVEPTPHVDWSTGSVELLTERTEWPEVDRPRRAGVSSFGISGTNAHVILEQPPEPSATVPASGLGPVPVVISARSADALRAQAEHLLSTVDRWPVADVAASLVHTRTLFEHRAVVVAEDRDDLAAGLAAVAGGEAATGVAAGSTGVVFVFPGQGTQWVGMATELMAASPEFAARMAECADVVQSCVDWDFFAALDDPAALETMDVLQPLLWAVMVSLAEVWRSAGVEPVAVLGQSQGEIAAACVAGALSLADGARVVTARSKLIADRMVGTGGLASVALSEERARHRLADWPGLAISGVASPGR
ncbi:hypothetical protein GCM10029964_054740 [Kibdelosporangium lantanae]